ncbi:MAG: carbon starvation protein A [Deltaproteobacteria bacterium]|nr:carbon starvation protein A [Deltaproteobacteria bacterium]
MPVAVLFLGVLALFGAAFFLYGRLLAKRFDLSADAPTPAHELYDGVDYVPTPRWYLLSQHFSAISAAGPIVGPIVAAVAFGWLPALLWIVVGAIFIGAMHDFSALVGSVRHRGRSIAAIIQEHMSKRAGVLFLSFVYLALIYIIVAFTDITARAFVDNLELPSGQVVRGGGVATASILYLVIGVVMGLALRYLRLQIWPATAIFVPLVVVAIWYSQNIPIELPTLQLPLLGEVPPNLAWDYLILIYCGVASVVPVWALLQPRGHLGGFFLYGMIFASFIGILLGGQEIAYAPFLGFQSEKLGPMFPLLFVTIACGACSGFHGIVCSGTTSKQLEHETDAHVVGYGGMLLEGVVAVIALITVAVLATDSAAVRENPNLIFARGIGNFLGVLGIDPTFAVSFGLLAFATFVYDTLDVATRLGRHILEELFGLTGRAKGILATLVTLLLPALLMSARMTDASGRPMPAWRVFWSIFGTSNQLLAALTLLSLSVWLVRTGRRGLAWLVAVPMVLMMVMTVWSLVLMMEAWVASGRYTDPVGWVALVLSLLAFLLVAEATSVLWRGPPRPVQAA